MHMKKTCIFLSFMLLFSVLPQEPLTVAAQENLFLNNGFEQGLEGWNTNAGNVMNLNGGFETNLDSWNKSGATCTWMPDGADLSSGCAFIDVQNGYNDISQTLNYEKGKKYRITVSLKASKQQVIDNISGETSAVDVDTVAQILISYQNGTEYLKTGTPINSRSWTTISTIYTCSADTASTKFGAGKLYLRIGPVPQNQCAFDYYVDEFYCEELTPNAAVQLSDGGADGSSLCAKVTKQGTTAIIPSQRISMEKTNWYIITADVKMDTGAALAQFGLRHGNYSIEYIGVKTNISTGWTRIKAFYQSFERRVSMSGDLFVSVDGTNSYYVDNLCVVKQSELFVNGDFETPNDVSGWKESYKDATGKTVFSSTAPAWVNYPTHNNSGGSAKVAPKINNNERTAQFVKLAKNTWYLVSFWVLLEEGSGTSEAQIIRTNIADDVDQGSSYMAQKTPVSDDAWTEVKAYFQSSGTNSVGDCQLFLRIGKNPSTDKITFYYDDFTITPVQPGNIKLTSDTRVMLPINGTITQRLQAVVTNEIEGQTVEKVVEMTNEAVEFSFLQPLPQGISFENDAITFSNEVAECNLELKMALKSNPLFYKIITLNIINELTNLANNIHDAEEYYASAVEKVDGSKERFRLAIDEAKAVVGGAPTFAEAQAATAALMVAKERFIGAVSKNELITAVHNAELLYENTQIGTSPGQCNVVQKSALNAAIETAAAVIDGYDITYNEAKDEVIKINNAAFSFQRSLAPFAKIYVDRTYGSDLGSGAEDSPFQTIERARNRVREISANMNSDIVVYLLGGDYDYSSHSLDFTEQDSGKNGFYNVYRAPNGEVPVINGGKRVDGWQMYDSEHNIYRAYAGNVNSRQLYVDGVRAIRARKDIADSSGWTYDNGEYGHTAPREFSYLSGLNQISEVELVYYSAWTNPRCKIETVSVDALSGVLSIKMQQPGWKFIRNKGGSSAKNPWYAENAYEFIDVGGEWYLDAASGYLYYKPRDGENMETSEAILGIKDSEIVQIKGTSPDRTVSHILFDGITFSYATWMRPSTSVGHSDAQNNHLRDSTVSGDTLPASAVLVEYGNYIDFTRCEFSHLGITALKMVKCIQNCNVTGNRFYDISGSALNIGDPSTGKIDTVYANNFNYLPAHEKYYIKNNSITSNYIHDTALEYRSAAAISAGFPIDTEISYNTISDTAYSGMHIGYGWKSIPTSIMKNNRIHHNRIINVMNTKINDGGGIYTIGPTSGTEDEPNLIYENYFEGQTGYGGSVYNDQGSSFWRVERNVSNLAGSPIWVNTNKEHRWLNYWSVDNNDMFANNNYASDYQLWEDHGQNNYLGNTHYVTDLQWPQEAQSIISNAGLLEEYDGLISYVRGRAEVFNLGVEAIGKARIENKTEQEIKIIVALAIYNPSMKLIKLGLTPASIPAQALKTVTSDLDTATLTLDSGSRMKIMIFEGENIGVSKLLPICSSKSVELN